MIIHESEPNAVYLVGYSDWPGTEFNLFSTKELALKYAVSLALTDLRDPAIRPEVIRLAREGDYAAAIQVCHDGQPVDDPAEIKIVKRILDESAADSATMIEYYLKETPDEE